MATSTTALTSTPFLSNKKDSNLAAFSSSLSFSFRRCERTVSKKICSAMAPQQSERKPSATGSVKTAMTMTEKIFAKASQKTQLSPGENVWVNVDVLMNHDVCGPGSIGIFKKEFGENTKVWDREKVVIIPDHYIFTSDERANHNVDILRDFSKEQNLKYFYDIKDLSDFRVNPDYKGVCHVALAQESHCKPEEVLLGTDSHTCTAGAFGQFASGIGNTDAGFVLGIGKSLLKCGCFGNLNMLKIRTKLANSNSMETRHKRPGTLQNVSSSYPKHQPHSTYPGKLLDNLLATPVNNCVKSVDHSLLNSN